jgi:ABC-type transport system involved in cytochrome bd biosynthesis fused ATPase/permease subunit
MLAGIETPAANVDALPQVVAAGCEWMSTEIYVPAGTLADAIGWNRRDPDRAALHQAAERVGLLDETMLPGGLAAGIADGGVNLSAGQRMRIGIARILLSDRVVLADEPTAKLDRETAKLIRGVLSEVAQQRLVFVATHDERLIEAADRHYVLRLQSQSKEAIAA